MINSERLKAAREAAGLSQSELAERLDVDRNLISMAEIGKQPLAIKHLVKVCSLLGVSADYLLGISDNDAIRQQAVAVVRQEMTQRLTQMMLAVAHA